MIVLPVANRLVHYKVNLDLCCQCHLPESAVSQPPSIRAPNDDHIRNDNTAMQIIITELSVATMMIIAANCKEICVCQ